MDWSIAILIGLGSGVSGIIYSRTVRNSTKITTLQVEFAKMSNIPALIEKHEQRQDKIIDNFESHFKSIDDKLEEVRLNVATLAGKRIKE